ncbi:MAG: cell division protein FtsX [Minisyncoccota bacterium]
MQTLKLWRTFKEGKENFRRNGWLTFTTISILALSLFIISLSVLLGLATQSVLKNMREKVTVNISFNPDVPEERIVTIQDELRKFTKEISSVTYVSREDALKQFLAESGNDPVIAQAIEEIGENPLLASIVIKAVRQEDYPLIVEQIKNSTFQNDISRINYDKNKKIFERLDRISTITTRIGLFLGSLFVLLSILITFNAIRITIYSHRQEFEIMRLVGASNIYVRMPFVFEGVLYGLVASLVTMLALFGVAYGADRLAQGALLQNSILSLYLQHFFAIFGSILLFGVGMGVFSSALAIHRYLKT